MLAKHLKMFTTESKLGPRDTIVEEVSGEMNDKKKLGVLISGEKISGK